MLLVKLKQRTDKLILSVFVGSTSTSDVYGTVMLGPKSRRVSLKRDKEVTFECFATGK